MPEFPLAFDPARLPSFPSPAGLPVGVAGAEPEPEPAPCLFVGELGLAAPRRPTTTSLMNGQIYDVRTGVPHQYDSFTFGVPRVSPPLGGWHAPHVASYSAAFTGSSRVWAIEVLDDDGNFNSRVTENLTLEQLETFKARYRDGTDTVAEDFWRPRSITACTVSERFHGDDDDGEHSFSTRFSVSWIADNWGADHTQNDLENWEIFVGQTKEQVEELVEACGPSGSLAGWRPISVCGYAYAYDTVFVGGLAGLPNYEAVRYAVVMVKDQIDVSQWKLEPELTRAELDAKVDEALAAGKVPISISSWRSNMGVLTLPGFVVVGGEFENQRWSLLTIDDRSVLGILAAAPGNFAKLVVPADQLAAQVAVYKNIGWRPICIAPFTSGPTGASYEEDYDDISEIQMFVIFRQHPPRYWRVKYDATWEPADRVPFVPTQDYEPSRAEPSVLCRASMLPHDSTTSRSELRPA